MTTTKLRNIFIKHLPSAHKSVTKREKPARMDPLGTVFQSLGEYGKAKEYPVKALVIRIQIGDKEGEAISYGNLGIVCQSVGEYDKSKEYLEKALATKKEIGDETGEASSFKNAGPVFIFLGKDDKAK